jgi:antitoxin (DNA-binding transcriptional repressor) of toxin-antitoxin stability system
MVQVSLEEAMLRLPQLIREAKNGEEIVLVENELPFARVIPLLRHRPKAQFGSARGLIELSDNWDDTPEGFENYMS